MSDDANKLPPDGAAEPVSEASPPATTPETADASVEPSSAANATPETAGEGDAPEAKTAEAAEAPEAKTAETAEAAEAPEAKTAETAEAAEAPEAKTAETAEAAEAPEAKTAETAEAAEAPEAKQPTPSDASSGHDARSEKSATTDESPPAVTTRQDGTDPTVVKVAPPKVVAQIAGMTDVGRIREHNEDNLLVADLTSIARDGALFDSTVEVGESGILLAVCDGMGGALAGEVASQMAVDVVHAIVQDGEDSSDEDGFAQKLVAAVQEAGARIYLAAKTNRNQHGMGTTATVAGVSGGRVYVGQVGDSRAYLLRKGRLRQITKDQSLVSKLIEAGQLTEDEAESYEHAHIILQALGTSDAVCVDLSYADLRKGDVLMLCSDGLSGLATNEQIREILSSGESPMVCAEKLTECANDGGGHDNITVVIARFDGELPEATDEDVIQGYQAYVLSRPLESLVGGRASTSLKIPDLPPPGSDLKNRRSYPPDAPLPRYDDDDDAPRVSVRAPAKSRDDDHSIALPMERTPWGPMVVAAVILGVLLGAWLAMRGETPSTPTPTAPAQIAPTTAPETSIDSTHAVDPTPLPAPAWEDAGAVDVP